MERIIEASAKVYKAQIALDAAKAVLAALESDNDFLFASDTEARAKLVRDLGTGRLPGVPGVPRRDVSDLDAFPSHDEAVRQCDDMYQRDLAGWARNWSESNDAGRMKRKETIRWILKKMKPETREKFMAELSEKQLMEIEEFTRDLKQLFAWERHCADVVEA
jgi:hypothetical protein